MNKSNGKIFRLVRPVALVGMMGAGKTSLGRAVAGLMGVPYVDADAEIESAAGQSVADIFSTYGEKEFRRRERQVIARLLREPPAILSLGGGAFVEEETRRTIKERALSVWLKVDRTILIERVLRHKETRPMLQGDNPEAKLTELLERREPFYAQAELTVVCDDRPVSHNARHVLESIDAYESARQGLELGQG